jgi:hypothetical protein
MIRHVIARLKDAWFFGGFWLWRLFPALMRGDEEIRVVFKRGPTQVETLVVGATDPNGERLIVNRFRLYQGWPEWERVCSQTYIRRSGETKQFRQDLEAVIDLSLGHQYSASATPPSRDCRLQMQRLLTGKGEHDERT